MMKAVSSFAPIFALIFVLSCLGPGDAGHNFRLQRYKSLYESHKCSFPASPKTLPLFGVNGVLAKCGDVKDRESLKTPFNLTDELCQPLLDELLMYCHAEEIPQLRDSGLLGTHNQTVFLASASVVRICDEPLMKRYRDNSFKGLADKGICQTVCNSHLYLCRLQMLVWKLANLTAEGQTDKSEVTTTALPSTTTPQPTTTTTTTTTTRRPPRPSVHEVIQGVFNNHEETGGNSGDDKEKPKPKTQAASHHRSIGVLGKLFIFFGVFSIILIVGGYVAYYKRSQIRAFCCEDAGDVRYRRIREDRKQQAAQPLKNLAF